MHRSASQGCQLLPHARKEPRKQRQDLENMADASVLASVDCTRICIFEMYAHWSLVYDSTVQEEHVPGASVCAVAQDRAPNARKVRSDLVCPPGVPC